MATLTVPQSDYGFTLSFTIQDSTGAAYNLTGYTIKLKVWRPGNSTLLVDGTCSIVVAANGTCNYTVASGDFALPGTYYAELQLTQAGVQESTQQFTLVVQESV